MLDQVEAGHPELRVVRFRPGLVFQRAAASEVARYFLGPFVPLSAMRRRLIPVIPSFDRLAFQCVHADDVGRAFARAVGDPAARGAYNLAAAVPVMSSERARAELGWAPRHSSEQALLELLGGMHDRAGGDTPPLRPDREASEAGRIVPSR